MTRAEEEKARAWMMFFIAALVGKNGMDQSAKLADGGLVHYERRFPKLFEPPPPPPEQP